MHISNFLEHKAIGACVGRGGKHGWQVEDVSEGSVAEDVVAEVVRVVIAHDLGQADLVVDDEEGLGLLVSFLFPSGFLLLTYCVVLVESVPCLRGNGCYQQ